MEKQRWDREGGTGQGTERDIARNEGRNQERQRIVQDHA
jgi:hypothetical protein